MARAYTAFRLSAAGATLLGAGIGIGEADFKTAVSKPHVVEEARQLAPGTPNANRLDTIDGMTGNTGRIEAIAAPAAEPWCWQVNGNQVPRSQAARCSSLDNIAAHMVGLANARDELEYAAARWGAVRLGTPQVAWQVAARMVIPMTCVPE